MSISTALYNGTVKPMMAKDGCDATLVQIDKSGGDYDVETGTNTPGTPVQTQVRIMLFDFALLSNGIQTKTGTLIEANDKECYMDVRYYTNTNLASHPSPTGDYLIINGEQWAIKLVKEDNPSQSFTIKYNLLLRK